MKIVNISESQVDRRLAKAGPRIPEIEAELFGRYYAYEYGEDQVLITRVSGPYKDAILYSPVSEYLQHVRSLNELYKSTIKPGSALHKVPHVVEAKLVAPEIERDITVEMRKTFGSGYWYKLNDTRVFLSESPIESASEGWMFHSVHGVLSGSGFVNQQTGLFDKFRTEKRSAAQKKK